MFFNGFDMYDYYFSHCQYYHCSMLFLLSDVNLHVNLRLARKTPFTRKLRVNLRVNRNEGVFPLFCLGIKKIVKMASQRRHGRRPFEL